MKHSLGVRKIYGEDLTLTKLLMNFSGEEIIKIYVDNSIDFDKISSFAKGQENLKIEKYEGYRKLFDFYGMRKNY